MKIPNPWPNYPMARCRCMPSESVVTQSTRGELEVPDGSTEVMIEPVKHGRPNAEAVAQGRMWTEKWGLLEVGDYMKKVELEADEKAMAERKIADRLRKQQEDQQRAKAKEMEAKEAKEKSEPKAEPKGPSMDEWVDDKVEQTTGPKIRLDDKRK